MATNNSDEALLKSMWTTEMFDRFENDLRRLFREQASPEFLAQVPPEKQEEMIAALRSKRNRAYPGPKLERRRHDKMREA